MVLMSMFSSLSPLVVRISHLSLLEKCKPHLGPSASQDKTLVLAGLAFSPSDELERSSSPGHGHYLCLILFFYNIVYFFFQSNPGIVRPANIG